MNSWTLCEIGPRPLGAVLSAVNIDTFYGFTSHAVILVYYPVYHNIYTPDENNTGFIASKEIVLFVYNATFSYHHWLVFLDQWSGI